MSPPKLGVALASMFFASMASVVPSLNTDRHAPIVGAETEVSPFAATLNEAPAAWPPKGIVEAPAEAGAESATARMERTSTGAHRLVVEKKDTFMHIRYREVASAGPDWASIELRAGKSAPEGDVAVWESTDPRTLETRRGLIRFSLSSGAAPEVVSAEAPRKGPRSVSPVRDCQSHEDGASGFVVVCKNGDQTSSIRAIRPTAEKPLSGAWVWDVPRDKKGKHVRFARFDLPLSPGSAEVGALAYVHGGRGVVLRADAVWAHPGEAPSLLFTETDRLQPVSPVFSWGAPSRSRR